MSGRCLSSRAAALAAGLLLVLAGLALVDWRQGVVLSTGGRVRTGTVAGLVDATWWPWAQGAGGLALALLGLLWLASHRPRRSLREVPVGSSDRTGTVVLALDGVARALCEQVEASGTTTEARAGFHRAHGRLVGVLEARLSEDADLDGVVAVAEEATRDLRRALPGDAADLQLRWRAPRTRRPARSRRATVRLE